MISMNDARSKYTAGNNQGMGFSPYTDDVSDDSIESAIEAAVRDGWELVLNRSTSDDVAVLQNKDGELMAIGGDAAGDNAWAVMISDLR